MAAPPARCPRPGRPRSHQLLLLLLLLLSPPGIWAEAGDTWLRDAASFEVAPLFPLVQGLAPYPNISPAPTRAGRVEVTKVLLWTNTLRYDPGLEWPGFSLLVDCEGWTERTRLEAGLATGLSLEVWLEEAAIGGGILDPFLSAFHRNLGFANQYRDLFPDDGLGILVVAPGGIAYRVVRPAAGPVSWGFGLAWSPWPEGPALVALRIKPPAPSPEPWVFGRAVAAELAAGYQDGYGPLQWGLFAGLAFQGSPDRAFPLPIRSLLPQCGARLFARISPGLALGLEAAASFSPILAEEMYLGGPAGNLWAGALFSLDGSTSLQVALIEELVSWASVEVGLQCGLRYILHD